MPYSKRMNLTKALKGKLSAQLAQMSLVKLSWIEVTPKLFTLKEHSKKIIKQPEMILGERIQMPGRTGANL